MLFKISAFSRLSRVSLKTLRYYDQIGILKPRKVDHDTGYRYYSADQLLELNRILIYKELGFTLPQITQLLQEHITLENIQGMFQLKKAKFSRLSIQNKLNSSELRNACSLWRKRGTSKLGKKSESKRKELGSFFFRLGTGG